MPAEGGCYSGPCFALVKPAAPFQAGRRGGARRGRAAPGREAGAAPGLRRQARDCPALPLTPSGRLRAPAPLRASPQLPPRPRRPPMPPAPVCRRGAPPALAVPWPRRAQPPEARMRTRFPAGGPAAAPLPPRCEGGRAPLGRRTGRPPDPQPVPSS